MLAARFAVFRHAAFPEQPLRRTDAVPAAERRSPLAALIMRHALRAIMPWATIPRPPASHAASLPLGGGGDRGVRRDSGSSSWAGVDEGPGVAGKGRAVAAGSVAICVGLERGRRAPPRPPARTRGMARALSDGPRARLAVPPNAQGHLRPRPAADRRDHTGTDTDMAGPRHWLCLDRRVAHGSRADLLGPRRDSTIPSVLFGTEVGLPASRSRAAISASMGSLLPTRGECARGVD